MYISSTNTQPLLMPIITKQKFENIIFEGVSQTSIPYNYAVCFLHKDYEKNFGILLFTFAISFVAFLSIGYENRKTIPISVAGLLGMCICPIVLLKMNHDYENKPLSQNQISELASQVMKIISQMNCANSLKIRRNIETLA